MQQLIGYHFQCLGFFSFSENSYSVLLSAPWSCDFCACKHVLFEGSSFYSCIGMWLNNFNKLRIYFFITPYMKCTYTVCWHLQPVLTSIKKCLEIKPDCSMEVRSLIQQISHSAFKVFNSHQLLATTYLQGVPSPLSWPMNLDTFKYFQTLFLIF